MKKIILSALFVFFLVTNLFSQEPVFVTSVEGIKEYSLPNGLKILLIPDAAQSNVIVNIVYGVGSRHEGYGESGMAHLLEHMMFKRSSKFTDIKKTIADKGAQANGTTYYDRTNYYEALPATDENLKWALEMEADRMVTSAILQSDLNTEFSVVRNEFEIGENDPSGILNDRILSTAYLWHNYGKSTIGSKEDIERVPASRLKVFYQKYYQPNNATLIVGGKFDEKKTLSWIKEYFAPIPKSKTEIEKTYTVEPVQDGERFVELKRNGDLQYIGMAYHTPSYSDKEFAANDALISILTNNPSGILYKTLVETKLSTTVYGYTLPLKDPGFSYFGCDVAKDKDINVVQKAFLETMNTVPNMTFTEEDLKRAKNELLKHFENTYNKTLNLSIALTEFIGAGDWRLFFINRDNIEALTVADIQNAAKKYYLQSNRTWGRFIPEKNSERTKVNDPQDIAPLVKGYKGKAMEANTNTFEASAANIMKATEEGKLASGGRYALLEKPAKGNKIEGRLLLRMGDEKSLSQKSMIAELTASMLKLGTKTRSKKDINDQIDQYKLNLSTVGSVDGLYVRISTDKANLGNALNLVQDILRNPSFDVAEFEKLKLEAKSGLESQRNEPQAVASQELVKTIALYLKTHPFYTETIDESLATLDKITIDDLKNFYATFYGGSNSIASFVGGIDKDLIKKFLSSTLDNWSPKVAYKRIPTQYFDVKSSDKTIQINDKTNAVLFGRINLNVGEKNPDYPALEMANELLGGGSFLSSRIPQRLRETEGLSYGAGSYLQANAIDPTGDWGVYAFYNPTMKDKLATALNEEIQKAISKGFTKEEFDSSLKSWLQNRQTMLGTDEFIVRQLRENIDLGKTFKDYQDFETKVKSLDVQKVNSALVKYFDPKKLVIINAGDFAKK
ncbi:M16 family metallopeptidase [Flavobacterium gilvum]|uniref:Peptidase M16 n=1 Tax=Flavobacterium gilvum TaxID=1492737 RepID=A0AAC9I6T3_9FLAO|nr:pitrilysin family protein [Flavobacterium gilvum]AOW10770.1 peptidase M16 [Flavobacterium gilvum]KFC58460.1 peptidase M16 [Flavobacterium gilvum]